MTVSKRRKALAAASAVLGGVLVLSACGGGDDDGAKADGKNGGGSSSQVDKSAAEKASAARIKIAPANGSNAASINNAGQVSVSKGSLTAVSLTASDGTKIAGAFSADKTSWKPSAQLERATTYKVNATAKDGDGRVAHENGTFTTVSPQNSFIGNFTPEDGSTVGVGMPVSINFDKAITEKDKKAVQAGIKVSSSSNQEVVGHWFGNQRLDFRPEQYWQAGSTVSLKLDLDGVEGADGVFGVQQKTVTFKIGRSQVSTVDAQSKTMKVERDGKVVKTIPISAGSPDNKTYEGQMVISEKYKQTRMDGSTVGFTDDDGKGEYDIKDVPHAMRLSSSGTFIHGNYWGSPSIFGSVNTSHGCVGLQDAKGANNPNTNGAWFYDNSMIGDVVVVKNTGDKTISPDNGLNGWNLGWDQWKQGSAV